MEALILSCGTGGGHNAAGRAVKEELEARGHRAVMLDPYKLAGEKLSCRIDNTYIKLAQEAPGAFGFIYSLGEMVRKIPGGSPVYWANSRMADCMNGYLQSERFDVVMMPHLFPAEILTYMKRHGYKVPKMIFIATDYSCIPFTEETDCDYFVIPSSELADDFKRRNISGEKLLPLGIPVGRAFNENITKDKAKRRLGLEINKKYILISGGSIGAGRLCESVKCIKEHISNDITRSMIIICGNNEKLYGELISDFKQDEQIIIIKSTEHMADYMKSSEVFITKPGGLSSTEAAVAGVPLIHISPIPGCENLNLKFFTSHGMSIDGGRQNRQLIEALEKAGEQKNAASMIECQGKYINKYAAVQICDFAEGII